MSHIDENAELISERDRILTLLEPDQFAEARKRPFPKRHLKGTEVWLLWCMRIYLFFMIAVVVYQLWTGQP